MRSHSRHGLYGVFCKSGKAVGGIHVVEECHGGSTEAPIAGRHGPRHAAAKRRNNEMRKLPPTRFFGMTVRTVRIQRCGVERSVAVTILVIDQVRSVQGEEGLWCSRRVVGGY